MVLSETLRLQLFQVNRGGIGSSSGTPRFGVGPQDRLILTLELFVFGAWQSRQTWTIPVWLVAPTIYVVSIVSFSGSKRSPFFHTANVIAAILRANVSRANSGRNPCANSR